MSLVPASITARYGYDGSVEVAGSAAALRYLAMYLRSGEPISVELLVPDQPADPYAGHLRTLTIQPSEHNVLVSRKDNELVVSGAMRARDILAANIEDFSNKPGEFGDHLHVEPFPGHFYMLDGSAPLVVAIA